MKVLMTADTVGGVFTYTAELARELRAAGDEVVVATMGDPLRAEQRRALAGCTVHESTYALEWMDDRWDDVAASGAWLLELAGRERPDVVHLNGFAHGSLPWPAPAVVVAHSDVASWWRAVRGTEAPPQWDRYRAEVSAGLHAADAVVAITHAVARDLRRHYDASAQVIHNGSRARATTPGKEPIILGAGRLWDEAKNLVALDTAAPGLPWPVTVAGELGEAQAHHARTTGHLSAEQLATLRRRAAIFAAPAKYEPFGLAILEAARDRCALVLGDVPSLRELWQDAAVFVDPEDPRALHEALARLAEDDGERDRLAEAAQARSARFTVAAAAAEYRTLYERLGARVPA